MSPRYATLALSLTGLAAITASATAQSDQYAVRAIGITKLDTSRTVVNTIAIACVRPHSNNFVDCVPQGTGVLRVDAATKTKLKLASAVIAKGTIVAAPASGEGEDGGRLKLSATSAVRKKLKTLRTFTVTTKITVTSPISEVLTKKLKWTTTSSGVQRLLMRSSGDTFDLGGGRG